MNKKLSSLLIYLGVTFVALIVQTAFWPSNLQNHGFFPQVIIPLSLYFFLYFSFALSFYFIYGITLFTMSLSSYSFLHLFIIYLLMYSFVFISKHNYDWKQSKFFFISCFIWSFFFPFIVQFPCLFSKHICTTPSFTSCLMSALITLGVSYMLLPLLEALKTTSGTEYSW